MNLNQREGRMTDYNDRHRGGWRPPPHHEHPHHHDRLPSPEHYGPPHHHRGFPRIRLPESTGVFGAAFRVCLFFFGFAFLAYFLLAVVLGFFLGLLSKGCSHVESGFGQATSGAREFLSTGRPDPLQNPGTVCILVLLGALVFVVFRKLGCWMRR